MDRIAIPLISLAVFAFFWYRNRKKNRPAGRAAAGPSQLSAEARALGLLPAEQQNTEFSAPAPARDAVLAAVASGDWQQAAAVLERTGEDWDTRSELAFSLAEAAAKDDAWLSAWEQARPADPDAALLRAWSTVCLAWDLRGAAQADHTSREQFDNFHRVLARSRDEIARAAELGPKDPVPYLVQITMGLGLGMPHEQMHAVWSEAVARAPFHYGAHYTALQYWCEKWRGSHDLARRFAAQAAASAPAGSLLTAMPLVAFYEEHLGDVQDRDCRTPEVVAMTDALLADVAAAGDHPRWPEARHLLAYFLTRQGRHVEALEQFRAVDGYVDALPWRYSSDPAAFYCRMREVAVQGAAAR